MEFICACASDNGEDFIDRHFGESRYFFIYRVDDEGIGYIKRISNSSTRERTHADPTKAQSVSSLLKGENVQVLLSRHFGPNLKRIRAHFVPVIVKQGGVAGGLRGVLEKLDQIHMQWCKDGNQRKALILRPN